MSTGDVYGLGAEVYIEAWQNARSIREAQRNLADMCKEAHVPVPPRNVLVGQISKLRASGVRLDYLDLEDPIPPARTLNEFAENPEGARLPRFEPRPPEEKDSREVVKNLLQELRERKQAWALV